MVVFAFAILLLLASLLGVTLEKAYFYLPAKELDRRAVRGDRISGALYRAAAYDGELRTLLITLIVITAATGLVLFTAVAPFTLGLFVTVLALTLCFFWQPRTRLTPLEARLAMWCSPALVWGLAQLHPLLRRVLLPRHLSRRHTGLYEPADLDELFTRQAHQRDNRVHPAELERLRNVLRLGISKVRDILVAPKHVVAISEAEAIGPVLVSELHRTGHSRFPVYDGKKSNIIGLLSLNSIADVKQHGLVRDNIDRHLVYLNEDDTLEQALKTFYETQQQLFIVVGSNGEYMGIVTISDILKRILGSLEQIHADKYEDRDAVASRHANTPSVSRNATEVVQ